MHVMVDFIDPPGGSLWLAIVLLFQLYSRVLL